MVDKEGTDGEKDAIKAYRAAREESDHSSEGSESDEVSSALIEKVRVIGTQLLWFLFFLSCDRK